MKENVTVIVPAAGFGKRFSPGTNKPFHPLLDKPLVVWALEVFEGIEEIREVIPVLKEEDVKKGGEIFEGFRLSKIKRIVPGGKERQDSVYNGLKAVREPVEIVLIHDGARPLVERDLVRTAIREIEGYDGVVAAVPVKDTIKEVAGGLVKGTLRRDSLWSVQTPQVFLLDVLMSAYQRAMADRFYSTDDSALIERVGGKVRVVMGSYSNIKVTTPEDIPAAELFLKKRYPGKGAGA